MDEGPATDADIGVLCNDAELNHSESTDTWKILGDPTESRPAGRGGQSRTVASGSAKQYPREGDRPFDSERKMMTTFHRGFYGNQTRALTKGRAGYCAGPLPPYVDPWGIRPISNRNGHDLPSLISSWPHRRCVCLPIAFKPMESPTEGEIERDMIMVGLTGLIDRPVGGQEAIHPHLPAGRYPGAD